MHHKVISDLVTRPNARRLCACTLYYSNQKHTRCGNLYLKWCKYIVPKWKINLLKRWLVQSSSYWTRIILQDNPMYKCCWHETNQYLVRKQGRKQITRKQIAGTMTCSKSTASVSWLYKQNDTDGVCWWRWTNHYVVETYAMTSKY